MFTRIVTALVVSGSLALGCAVEDGTPPEEGTPTTIQQDLKGAPNPDLPPAPPAPPTVEERPNFAQCMSGCKSGNGWCNAYCWCYTIDRKSHMTCEYLASQRFIEL